MKKIAIASGKGGTGKTTVAVMLSRLLSKKFKVRLLDCDVENPDCHIFFSDAPTEKEEVCVFYPEVDTEKCNCCGRCQQVCEFNCLFVMKDRLMFFGELCHSCRGCKLVCPQGAISEGSRPVGKLFNSKVEKNLHLDYALMNVGEARATPLIEKLKKNLKSGADYAIFDSPPGASCPMAETVAGCNYAVLVAEPTPFGIYDLKIAAKVVKKLGVPCGIVINRSGGEDKIIDNFARQKKINILFRIPYSRKFSCYYSKGVIKENFFPGLADKIIKEMLRI